MKYLLSFIWFICFVIAAPLAIAQTYPSPTFNNITVKAPAAGIVMQPASGPLVTSTAPVMGLQNGTGLGSGQVTTALGFAPLLNVASNTAMKGTSSLVGQVERNGYYVNGDAPSLMYIASTSACSLNSGNGDGGSQVPTSDGKCWVARFPTTGIDVLEFGAKCDNLTDDTVSINSAIAYALSISPSIVRLPSTNLCKITSTITVGQAVTLKGAGNYFSGLSAGAINMNPMIYISGNSESLQDLYFLSNLSGVNTSGSVIKTSAASTDVFINNLKIHGPCNAIDVSGSYDVITNVYVDSAAGSACNTIQVGSQSVDASSTDIKMDRVIVSGDPSNRPNSCLAIYDSGGLFISHGDYQNCTNGTRIVPGANQWVAWATISDTYLGDTSNSHGVYIDTSATTAVVEGLSCVNCWSSSSITGDGIRIGNTGSGIVSGIHFTNLRALSNANNGVTISNSTVDNVTIDNSHICAYGSAASGFYAVANASNFSIRNTELRPNCENRTSSGGVGINLLGNNSNIELLGLDLVGNTSGEINGTPVGSAIVNGIIDTDANAPSIASGSTITLSGVYKTWLISGTSTINTINGFWTGRKATLITTGGAVSFTGGNVCAPFTSVANVPVNGLFLGSCWYLK